MRLTLSAGDLARERVDAVINAANTTLLGGGGVDGAIHRGAGPELLAACRALPEHSPGVRCPTGEARITPGFGLPAAHVVHTVGPVHFRDPDPPGALARALRSSLALAAAHRLRTVAVPALSTGAFGYPLGDAVRVLVAAARSRAWPLEELRFVAFGASAHRAFEAAIARAPQSPVPPEPLAFRRAEDRDDPAVAAILREVMPPGSALSDPEIDHLAAAYRSPRAAYFVVEVDGAVVGGGGLAPLAGGDPRTAELRKMYFLPSARGRGLGERLLAQCMVAARGFGFERMYLETHGSMDAARRLYERVGFARRDAPLGDTGHRGCDRWYERALDDVQR